MFEAKHISVTYGIHRVLNNVSLTIGRGEIALFLGVSGGGKSTLLRVLSGLEPHYTGSLVLDLHEIDTVSIHEKQLVGMVLQQCHLFEHLTVLENITLALEQVKKYTRAQAQKKAYMLLERFELLEKSDAYPLRLSGGQKQRVALARALALHSPVICLDEPTSALDPQLSKYIGKLLHELAEQQLMVAVASHDAQLLEVIDCTIHLIHEGTVVESARSSTFKKSKENFPRIAQFIYGKNCF